MAREFTALKLNLRQIEVFRAIMLSGSISGASKLLYVSQPAVSRLIAYTEQRLGFLLFKRIKGRLHPTPEAIRLFAEVDAMYQSVQRVNEVAENLAENRIGQLRIASSPNLGQSLMPRAIALFCQRHPEVRVVLHTLIPSVMLQSLLSHQVELGITYMPVAHPSLEVRPLYKSPVVAVLPQAHHLATRPYITIDDLANESLINYSSDIPFGQLIQQIFGDKASQPIARVEVQQTHVACAMVQAGVGIALVDEITSKAPICADTVVIPLKPTTYAPVNVFNIQLEPLSRLANEFIQILEGLAL